MSDLMTFSPLSRFFVIIIIYVHIQNTKFFLSIKDFLTFGYLRESLWLLPSLQMTVLVPHWIPK